MAATTSVRPDHASIGDMCDLGCVCPALLHVDKSGTTATTNARLTSLSDIAHFPADADQPPHLPSACRMVLGAGIKRFIASKNGAFSRSSRTPNDSDGHPCSPKQPSARNLFSLYLVPAGWSNCLE